MYSVLIADDEEPVLDSYSYLIEQAVTGFKVCGKARSGDEAAALIYQLKPDVALLDIAMPGMDGIEVIEQVHERFANTIFILSTAYERFDLAQRAIPLGVFAYLVKPVSKKTFVETLERVRLALEKNTGSEKKLLLAKKDFFTRKIWQPLSENDWKEMKALYSFNRDYFCAALIQCKHTWRGEIVKRLSFKYRVYESEYLSMLFLLVPVEKNGAAAFLEDLKKTIAGVLPAHEEYAIGCGEAVEGKNLYVSCDQALRQISQKNTCQLKKEQALVADLRATIKNAAEYETCLHDFTACWKYLFSIYDLRTALAKMCAIFYLLGDDLFGMYSHSPEFEADIDFAGEVSKIEDLETWQRWSAEALFSLYARHGRLRLAHIPQPLDKALQYIKNHYAAPLFLSQTAKETGVSEAYLSRLFAEHLHKGFSDFLAETRIEHAKELLAKKDLHIKEVSFLVGFQDPNYFSKIFKKITGTTPKDYRGES